MRFVSVRLALIAALLAVLLAPLSVVFADEGRRAGVDRDAARAEKRAKRQTQQQARRYRQLRVAGDELEASIERVTTELAWSDSLETALAMAKETGRLVLHVQTLGDLDGFL